MVAVAANDVYVDLGGRAVVHGLNLAASGGSMTAIVGSNGSGKTTFLKALAGLVDFKGTIKHQGEDIRGLSAAERAQRVAYLPQTTQLNAMLSVREVIALSLYARRPGLFGLGRDDESRVDDAIDRLAIRSIEGRPYPQLSGGQQRLVLLARALATGSKTILLDEPTASLDLKYSLRLFDILEDLRRDGYCLVVVLHDLDDVCRHCQNALLIDTGRERFLGVPREAAFLKHTAATYGVSLIEADRIGFRLPNAASKSPTPSTRKSSQ